jgi:hypothetical protein
MLIACLGNVDRAQAPARVMEGFITLTTRQSGHIAATFMSTRGVRTK